MKELIDQKVEALITEIIEIRRHLHMHPEVGGQEFETSKFIKEYLTKLGLEVKDGLAKTGVMGLLKGKAMVDQGTKQVLAKNLALRADMDALPITEQTNQPYKSQNQGVMHACGHDAHVAILLVTAKVLSQLKEQFRGNIKFLFQPSEERSPGGALPMINEGVLDNPKVDGVLGLHVNPLLKSGVIGYRTGAIMANADSFQLVIKGKGGHGAAPHQTVDAIVLSAMVIQSLQLLASRFVDPLEPVVVTVGTIQGGYAGNIIADQVIMKGTIRTFSPDLRKEVPEKIEELVAGIVKGYGGDFEFSYYPGYPALVNHQGMTEDLRKWAAEILGSELVEPLSKPSMGGEDFAYFTREVPGTFFNLGVAPEGDVFPWHHPCFDMDEKALANGVKVMVYSSLKFLANEE